MPEISVIVPVYNVEKYLDRCVESILAQTFTDFELILVDDGSPDNCPQMCDNWAKKDSRIRVIHQTNQGVSASRNVGIKNAYGKYIMFCDSDDVVSPIWCEFLCRAIKNKPTALVFSDYQKTIDTTLFLKGNLTNFDEANINEMSYFGMYKSGCSAFSWNKIFVKDILIRNSVLYKEDLFYAEDVAFCVDYYMHCDCCVCVPIKLYGYYYNQNSVMNKYFPNLFEMHLMPFSYRLSLLTAKEKIEYCDEWLYRFLQLFDNVFDKRNIMPFVQKIKYNNKMIKSKEFGYCIEYASGKNESPIVMKILRKRNYYLYWAFRKVAGIKNKFKKK